MVHGTSAAPGLQPGRPRTEPSNLSSPGHLDVGSLLLAVRLPGWFSVAVLRPRLREAPARRASTLPEGPALSRKVRGINICCATRAGPRKLPGPAPIEMFGFPCFPQPLAGGTQNLNFCWRPRVGPRSVRPRALCPVSRLGAVQVDEQQGRSLGGSPGSPRRPSQVVDGNRRPFSPRPFWWDRSSSLPRAWFATGCSRGLFALRRRRPRPSATEAS